MSKFKTKLIAGNHMVSKRRLIKLLDLTKELTESEVFKCAEMKMGKKTYYHISVLKFCPKTMARNWVNAQWQKLVTPDRFYGHKWF